MENEPLVRDLVEWVSKEPRPYAEVMDAWRTSCPRLTVWEDAVENRFVKRDTDNDGQAIVRITDSGRRFLQAS